MKFNQTIINIYFVFFLGGYLYLELGGFSPGLRYQGENTNTIYIFIFAIIIYNINYKYWSNRINVKVKNITFNKTIDIYYVYTIYLVVAVYLLYSIGLDSFTGAATKAEIRIDSNILDYSIRKMILPLLMAIVTYKYINKKVSLFNFIVLFLVTIFLSSLYGFKATFIFVLLPSISLFFFYKNYKLSKIILYGIVLLLFIVINTFYFNPVDGLSTALLYLITRATVMISEVPWYVVNKIDDPSTFEYYNTVIGVLGSDLAGIITGENIDTGFNYSKSLTLYVGIPIRYIEIGHNVTGTFFTEGILAFGNNFGILFISLVGSYLNALINKIIEKSKKYNYLITCLGSVYFFNFFFPWINSGGIGQLLSITLVFSLMVYFIIVLTNYFLLRASKS